MQTTFATLGRLLLAAIFLGSAIGKITDWSGTVSYIDTRSSLPLPPLMAAGAIVLELVGGLSLALGLRTNLGVTALIVFLVAATGAFHTNFALEEEMIQFMKNVAILGGLFMVLAHGPGKLSFDGRKKRDR